MCRLVFLLPIYFVSFLPIYALLCILAPHPPTHPPTSSLGWEWQEEGLGVGQTKEVTAAGEQEGTQDLVMGQGEEGRRLVKLHVGMVSNGGGGRNAGWC